MLYLTGFTSGTPNSAAYWRVTVGSSTPNIALASLYDGSYAYATMANAACVAGGDGYICGQDNNTNPVYWVNDKDHKTIITGQSGSSAVGIGVDV